MPRALRFPPQGRQHRHLLQWTSFPVELGCPALATATAKHDMHAC